MDHYVFEEKLIECFTDSEKNCSFQSAKVTNTVANIEKYVIDNRKTFNDAIGELANNVVLRKNMAQRMYSTLNSFYEQRGLKSRNTNKSCLMLERIIFTLGTELSAVTIENHVNKEFLLDVLCSDIRKFYNYFQYETPLAICFENYS